MNKRKKMRENFYIIRSMICIRVKNIFKNMHTKIFILKKNIRVSGMHMYTPVCVLNTNISNSHLSIMHLRVVPTV